MSSPRSGALVGAVVLCHVVAFLAFLLYAIIGEPPALLAAFRWRHGLGKAALLLIETMPALTAAGAMAAYSLFPARGAGPLGLTLESVVRPATVTFLALTLVYLGLTGLAAPALEQSVQGMERSSESASGYLAAMREAVQRATRSSASADYRAAREAANRYLEIDPDSSEVADALTAVERGYFDALAAESARSLKAASGEGTATRAEAGEDAVALLRRAEAFTAAGDYYSAHYYAGLAAQSEEVRERAVALLASADAKISPRTVLADKATPDEQAAAEQLKLKREAYALYERQDWIAAFYRFGELAGRYPDDRDIKNYHDLSRQKVLRTAFPIQEAREALRSLGAEDLLFTVNRGDRGNKGVEVVSIRRMARTPAGVFFSDIEVLRFTPGRGPTLHLSARYGKLSGATILLRAVDEADRGQSEEPRIYVATDPEDITVTLEPGYEPEALPYIRPDPRALRAVPAGILWGMRSWAEESGLLRELVELEIILFFVRPLLFLTMGLAALAFAWRYRARYLGRPAFAAYLSLAAFPFAMSGVWRLLVDGARLVYGGCLSVAGFVPTAIAALIVQAIAFFAALVVLARGAAD